MSFSIMFFTLYVSVFNIETSQTTNTEVYKDNLSFSLETYIKLTVIDYNLLAYYFFTFLVSLMGIRRQVALTSFAQGLYKLAKRLQ